MRINFLSIIVCFLFVCIAVSSCLDSEDTYIASSNATVHAFGLDTIHGKHYPFAIDQLNRKIYNLEPLPVGADTLLDSILIDTFQVAGYITSGLTTDTVLNLTAHQDLRGAINKINEQYKGDTNGLKFKVHAPDMTTMREYTLYLRVFEHHPDSMNWQSMSMNGLPSNSLANHQKTITLQDRLLMYVLGDNHQTVLYQNSTKAYTQWEQKSLQGVAFESLPHFVKLETIQTPVSNLQEVLYTVVNNQLYQSVDGITWTVLDILPENYTLQTLICGYDHTLIGLFQKDGKSYLIQTNQEITAWNLEQQTELPEGFPTENIYATEYQTANLLEQVMIVGRTSQDATRIIPWAYDGRNWTALNPDTDYASYCLTEKVGHNPAVMHYDKKFYIFGETLNYIYASQNRLAWYEADKKFFLPKELATQGNFTTCIDSEQYIWIITGGNSEQNKNAIWRGRLNKFGYDY